jgi:hypothetical protein
MDIYLKGVNPELVKKYRVVGSKAKAAGYTIRIVMEALLTKALDDEIKKDFPTIKKFKL